MRGSVRRFVGSPIGPSLSLSVRWYVQNSDYSFNKLMQEEAMANGITKGDHYHHRCRHVISSLCLDINFQRQVKSTTLK